MAEILPDVQQMFRVKCNLLGTGVAAVNLYYIQYTATTVTQVALDTFASALGAAWASAWAATVPSSVRLDSLQVWDLSSRTGLSAIDPTDRPGTRVANPLMSVNNAICISWSVQDRWRGGHFRTYHVGPTQPDLLDAKTFNTTYVTLVTTAATAWRNGINGLQFNGSPVAMAAVRYHGVLPDGTHGLFPIPKTYTITGVRVRNRPDSQRRRLGKELN